MKEKNYEDKQSITDEMEKVTTKDITLDLKCHYHKVANKAFLTVDGFGFTVQCTAREAKDDDMDVLMHKMGKLFCKKNKPSFSKELRAIHKYAKWNGVKWKALQEITYFFGWKFDSEQDSIPSEIMFHINLKYVKTYYSDPEAEEFAKALTKKQKRKERRANR